jgi:hypothetical protein
MHKGAMRATVRHRITADDLALPEDDPDAGAYDFDAAVAAMVDALNAGASAKELRSLLSNVNERFPLKK